MACHPARWCAGIITWWRRPDPQEGVIEERCELQCCNRLRRTVGAELISLVGVLQGDGHVHGRVGVPGASPVSDRVRRPGPEEGDRRLQCCNRTRNTAGQQPLPLPGATNSDPVWRAVGRRCRRAGVTGGGAAGRWLTRRDGAPGSSSGGRPGPAAWFHGAGDRGGVRGAEQQPFEVPRWPAVPADPVRPAAGGWPCPRAKRCAWTIT